MNVELGFLCLAYLGPGAGLTMLGALLAVVCVLLMALLSPLFYGIHLCRVWFRRGRHDRLDGA